MDSREAFNWKLIMQSGILKCSLQMYSEALMLLCALAQVHICIAERVPRALQLTPHANAQLVGGICMCKDALLVHRTSLDSLPGT